MKKETKHDIEDYERSHITEENHERATLTISYDDKPGAEACLIVSRNGYKKLIFVNAFYGDEAIDLYSKLTTEKETI